MTESTCHNLLAKIALAILSEKEQNLCIDDRILGLEELEELTSEKDEVHFHMFKKLVVSLFGNNLFTLDHLQVDTALRQVYFALYVPDDQEEQDMAEKMANAAQQKC